MEKEFKLMTPGQNRGGRGRTAAAVASGKATPPNTHKHRAPIPQPVVEEESFAAWRYTSANLEERRDLPASESRAAVDNDNEDTPTDILRRAGATRYQGELKARKLGARALQSGKVPAEMLYNAIGDYTASVVILCAAEDSAWSVPHATPMPAPRSRGHALRHCSHREHDVAHVLRLVVWVAAAYMVRWAEYVFLVGRQRHCLGVAS